MKVDVTQTPDSYLVLSVGMLPRATWFWSRINVRVKLAFRSGSSKHGKA